MSADWREKAGRAGGILCGTAVLVLWTIFTWFNPYAEATGRTTAALAPTLIGALLAVVGGLIGSVAALAIAFVAGFLWGPVGLYLLGTPGIFAWIGVAELGYLAAAGLIWWGRGAVGSRVPSSSRENSGER